MIKILMLKRVTSKMNSLLCLFLLNPQYLVLNVFGYKPSFKLFCLRSIAISSSKSYCWEIIDKLLYGAFVFSCWNLRHVTERSDFHGIQPDFIFWYCVVQREVCVSMCQYSALSCLNYCKFSSNGELIEIII
jgi:hypothetical protein